MSTNRIKVDIAESEGAPSPTAVFDGTQIETPLHSSKRLRTAYLALHKQGHEFSKIAIISKLEGAVGYRAVQVMGLDEAGNPVFECGRDCGNSMVASALVAIRRQLFSHSEEGHLLRMVNQDTYLTADMEIMSGRTEELLPLDMHIISTIGKTPKETLMNRDAAPLWPVEVEGSPIPVTTLNVVNPYVLVSASSLGIMDAEELLRLAPNDRTLIDRLAKVRAAVVKTLSLKEHSEFPKIAAVTRSDWGIAARTLYLDSLHKGLPITGIITLVVASRIEGSLLHPGDTPDDEILVVRSPKEKVKTSLLTDTKMGIIEKCTIHGRLAVMKHSDIELSLP